MRSVFHAGVTFPPAFPTHSGLSPWVQTPWVRGPAAPSGAPRAVCGKLLAENQVPGGLGCCLPRAARVLGCFREVVDNEMKWEIDLGAEIV